MKVHVEGEVADYMYGNVDLENSSQTAGWHAKIEGDDIDVTLLNVDEKVQSELATKLKEAIRTAIRNRT